MATLGTDAQRKFNVALSRARDRMVLFRSLSPKDVTNSDDMRLSTMQFFARGKGGGGHAPAAAAAAGRPRSMARLEAQLYEWLGARGYRFTTECGLGGAVAIVEDTHEDERLCICLDGGMGATLAEWRDERRAQTALERVGWRFHRIWRASWLVDRERCEGELVSALTAASIRPAGGDDPPSDAPRPPPPPSHAAGKRRMDDASIHGANEGAAAASAPSSGSRSPAARKRPKASDAGSGAGPSRPASPAATAAGPREGGAREDDRSPPVAERVKGVERAPKAERPPPKPKADKPPPPPKPKPAPKEAKKPKRKRGGDDDDWTPGDD